MIYPGWPLVVLPSSKQAVYLKIEKCVEVRDADMLVFHLAPHVFNGMNRRFIITVRFPLQGKVLYPAAADVMELAEHCAGQLHCFHLCKSTETNM